MIKMTMEQASVLANIFNNLMKISTSGDSTIVMGETIKDFRDFLAQIEVIENNEVQEGE